MRINIAIVSALVAAACGVTEPLEQRKLAFLGDSGIPVEVSVPDSVARNAPFLVGIVYYGSSSCTRRAEVDVERFGPVFVLRPFVYTPRTGNCTDDLRRFTVDATVVSAAPGPNEIRIQGRFAGRDTVIVRSVFVR